MHSVHSQHHYHRNHRHQLPSCPPSPHPQRCQLQWAQHVHPSPFLRNTILETMTPCPFKIIQAAIAAHTLYVREHDNNDGFSARDIEAHRNLLIMWCLAVGQESIPKTRFSLLPDNHELKKHKANTHREHIQPTLEAAAAAPIDPAETVQVLRQLGANMAHSCKALEAQTATQQASSLPKGEGQEEEGQGQKVAWPQSAPHLECSIDKWSSPRGANSNFVSEGYQ